MEFHYSAFPRYEPQRNVHVEAANAAARTKRRTKMRTTKAKTTKPAKTTRSAAQAKATAIGKIARYWFDRTSLQTKKDGTDFQETAVWCIKAALEAAYDAGRASR